MVLRLMSTDMANELMDDLFPVLLKHSNFLLEEAPPHLQGIFTEYLVNEPDASIIFERLKGIIDKETKRLLQADYAAGR